MMISSTNIKHGNLCSEVSRGKPQAYPLPEFSKSLSILVPSIFDSGEGVKCGLSLRGLRS